MALLGYMCLMRDVPGPHVVIAVLSSAESYPDPEEGVGRRRKGEKEEGEGRRRKGEKERGVGRRKGEKEGGEGRRRKGEKEGEVGLNLVLLYVQLLTGRIYFQ